MFFNKYPYTDFHELNLDFLLKNYKMLLDTLKSLDEWVDKHEKEYRELKKLVDDIENGQSVCLLAIERTQGSFSSVHGVISFCSLP